MTASMESLWGFEDARITAVENKSRGYKLVPWLTWDEWDFVRDSLFSSSPHSVALALNRISAWQSRGCLPVVIEVTASVIEIQQKDPYFRVDGTVDNLLSEKMLAMLYCMAIIRLVNGVVEKTRKHTEISIAEAADMIDIPRMLIDIRHEGSHRDLPSLQLLRHASKEALDWLKLYYWKPQTTPVAFQGDGTAKIRSEIKSKLHELVFCLKVKESPGSSSALVKGKSAKHPQWLCGRNNFSLTAGKLYSSRSVGSKKQIMKTMKNLLGLYSSFSSELVSVLLDYLLKASDSLIEVPNNSLTVSDEWKLVITKLSKKEPKLLLALLKAVLEMIQNEKAVEYEIGEQHLIPLEFRSENHLIERLSSLFVWLVSIRKVLKPSLEKGSPAENEDCSADTLAPRATLVDLIHKCLLVSAPGSEHLIRSAMDLAKMSGNRYLIEKLNKLSLLASSDNVIEEHPSLLRSEDLIQEEECIRQAVEKLEEFKLQKRKRKFAKTTTECDVGESKRWVVAKLWNTCPIGMLPRALGSSGRLPVLDSSDDYDHKEVTEPSERKELRDQNQCGKREARCDIDLLDNSNVKKMRATFEHCEIEGENAMLDGVKGQLMINGVWRKVREEELLAIRSAIRIFV